MWTGFIIVAYVHKVPRLLFDQAVFLLADTLLRYISYVMLACAYHTVGMAAAVVRDCLFCDEWNSLGHCSVCLITTLWSQTQLRKISYEQVLASVHSCFT